MSSSSRNPATLTPTPKECFFSRGDSEDPRLGDLARPLDSITGTKDLKAAIAKETSSQDVAVILGYPDDEGIRINGGRPGAAQAPRAIRKPLYKMTPDLERDVRLKILDAGDIEPSGKDLGTRHNIGRDYALATLESGARWVGVGGGHDYGFSEADAYCTWAVANGHRPLVINFDAHLDVRPTTKGLSSGTPFYRMMEKYHQTGIDFLEIGIQPQCKSRSHASWLTSRGGRILSLDQWVASKTPLDAYINKHASDLLLRPRPALISVDIDAFSSSVAPGCSQSWATGFEPREFFEAFDLLLARLDVRALGVYEVSPLLDQDDRTSKLAALIIHRFLFTENLP